MEFLILGRLIALFVPWLLCCAFALPADAATVHVDGSNGTGIEDGTEEHPYDTVQEAVDAADDGHTVKVAQGTYTGVTAEVVLVVGKTVHLRGGYLGGTYPGTGDFSDATRDANAHVTTIDGADARRCVQFVNAGGEFSGFTITRGRAAAPDGDGGGIRCVASSTLILDNVVIGNSAEDDGGGIACLDGVPEIRGCLVMGNAALGLTGDGDGGGIFCDGGFPLVTTSVIRDNDAQRHGGGIACLLSSATITRNVVYQNAALAGDGGGIFLGGSMPEASSNAVTGNNAGRCGGGIASAQSSADLRGNVVTGNTAAADGGGIHCTGDSSPSLICLALAGNLAGGNGGAVASQGGSRPVLTNCILWGDVANEGGELAVGDASELHVTYSDVQGGEAGAHTAASGSLDWGAGNLEADPLFVDAGHWDDGGTHTDPGDDAWHDGDYHLQAESPCINAGANGVVGLADTDIDGEPRIQQLVADIGADETPFVGAPVAPGPPVLDTQVMEGAGLNLTGPSCCSVHMNGVETNGNPAGVLYAVHVGDDPHSGWCRLVASDGRTDAIPDSAEAEWHVATEWAERRIRHLAPGTTYSFQALAKSIPGGAGLQSSHALFAPSVSHRTSREGDVNRSGLATALDYAYIRAAILRGNTSGFGLSWPCDLNDDGRLDGQDLDAARQRITAP